MNDEKTQLLILENSINLFSDFLMVISDGYNPSVIWSAFNLEHRLTYDDVFLLHSNIRREHFSSTKTIINNPLARVEDNLDWCLGHSAYFGPYKQIFESKYREEKLRSISHKIKTQISNVIKNWTTFTIEYLLETSEKFLLEISR